MVKDRPNIFSYHDYRQFLKDWFSYRASMDKDFSMRVLASQSQLSCAYLPFVLSGKRKLSQKALEKIGTHLGLLKSEREYLDLLRTLSDTESQSYKLETLKKMQKLKPYAKINEKEAEAYQYLTHWYYVAIRELVMLDEFVDRPGWIAEKLARRITEQQALKAWEFLKQNQYVHRDENGQWKQTNKRLDCYGGVYTIALNHFHQEILAEGLKKLQEPNADDRHILGYTLSYSKRNLSKIKDILNEASEKIVKLEQQTKNPDHLYHVTLYAFQLSSSKKPGAKGGTHES